MCRIPFSLLSAALLLGFAAGAHAADDETKAILTRAIKVHGGEETLSRYKAGQSKNKGKIKLPTVGEVEFTQETAYLLPDKFKETLELDIAGKKISVVTLVNGDKVSIETDGKEVKITDDIQKALKEAQYMMRTARLTSLLKDNTYEFAPLGEVKVEGKPAVGVRVSSKGHKDLNLFFSKETGLLAKLEHRTVEMGTGKEITEERIIVEYGEKSKEGIPVPRKVLIKHDGEEFMEAEIQEVKFLENLDESEFKK